MTSMPGPEPRPATSSAGTPRKGRGKGLLWALLAVVVAFLIGFFWQWYEADRVRDRLETTESELRVERLRIHLAQATMAAQAGDFETSRTLMSEFFTRLQEQQEQLSPDLARAADGILSQRDDVITGLSRANPAYAGVLYRMLGRMDTAAGIEGPGERTSPATPATPTEPEPGTMEPGTTGAEPDTSAGGGGGGTSAGG